MKKLIFVIVTVNLILFINEVYAQNLITNSSFESSGQSTGQNWYQYGVEISGSTFFNQDAPPDGGNWALKLGPGMPPFEGHADTYITGQSGTNIYELKVWMKTANNAWGAISIGVFPYQLTQLKWLGDSTYIWAQYTLIDTIITQPNDSIVVHLSAGYCVVCAGGAFFDLVELTILSDTITSNEIDEIEMGDNINVYPNPNTENKFVMEINISTKQDITIILSNINGQLIFKEKLHKYPGSYHKEIDLKSYPKGIYNLSVITDEGIFNKKMIVE